MPAIEAVGAEEDPFAPYYFQHEEQKICGELVSPITDWYDPNYPSVVDRFFTRYYYIKGGAPYQVLYHSNRICLICLAPTHPAYAEGIASVSYDVGNMDRSQNVVKGKAKKGGMILQEDTTLALLTTETGTVYKIPSCIRGKLVEVNTALQTDAKQLHQAAEGAGYFAILLPKIENCSDIISNLLTQQQYDEQLKKDET
ncbi:PREDICTED: FAM206 family protein CG9288 [Drosophila arizonae]|uniref:Protein Abitram n=1 Tax=Drosophila arizonae TaxID=7263 RepID=A0ABM1Q1J5_DROAR|nr:PREDICTED: FAM206 family protein CG9288 [Drosophila arizonae]